MIPGTLLHKRKSVFQPAGTVWGRVFYESRPKGRPHVVATVELTDGRRLAGQVGSFTSEMDPNRELALIPPLWASPSRDAPMARMTADFIVVREEYVASITGIYADLDTAATARADADLNGALLDESAAMPAR